MKVLITSGHTIERIDSVRSIINFSTGKLGSLIAAEFNSSKYVDKIFYLCNHTAVKPQSDKVEISLIDNVDSLELALLEILSFCEIDIIVHCMAVSDYKVKHITTMNDLSFTLDSQGKIESSVEDLVLVMEKTPKIISKLHKLSPSSIIVGFKLLDSVPHETLIDTGFRVLEDNKCTFVLANDLKDVSEVKHVGFLIDEQKCYTRYKTKMEIAEAIVSATVAKRRNIE